MLFCIHLHFTCIKIYTFEVKCSWHLTHNHITEESWCQHFHCTIPKNSKKMLIIWLLFKLLFNHSDRNEAVYIAVQEQVSWPKFSLGIYSFWGLTILLFFLVLILLIIHGINEIRVLYSLHTSFHMLPQARCSLGSLLTFGTFFDHFCVLCFEETWPVRKERRNWDGLSAEEKTQGRHDSRVT